MEYEVFLSKNSFLKSLVKEVQEVETSLWNMLHSENQEGIPQKMDYMQELIIQMLRVLNDIEVEILLFRVEKSQLGKQVEEDLEDLYVLIEMQKRQLVDIAYMHKEDISQVLDGNKADSEGFSESSERIKQLLEKIEHDGFDIVKEEHSSTNNIQEK